MDEATAIKAVMSIANDVTAGRIDPAELERVAVEECRELFGTVTGPDNPLWPLHVEVARGVLAAGGIPFGELQEWAGLARHRERGDDPPVAGADVPIGAETAYGTHGGEFGGAAYVDDEAVTEPDPAPQPEPAVDPYGPARRILARGRGLPVDNGLREV
jgi:hypothetical protein